MGISIFKVRIENFRSIKNLELTLSMINVVIGANNCGKSNFLKAMNVALGQNRTISSDDIYVDKDEALDNTKCATIDIMLRPVDDANNAVSNFSDFGSEFLQKSGLQPEIPLETTSVSVPYCNMML